ncbi:hypothetical protein H4S02_011854, partial [Coemansia sp. RSA 2611]
MTIDKDSDDWIAKSPATGALIIDGGADLNNTLDPTLEFPTYTRYAVVASCFVIQGLSCGLVHSWGVQQEYLAANVYVGETSKIKTLSYIGTLMYFSLYLWGMLAGWLAEV